MSNLTNQIDELLQQVQSSEGDDFIAEREQIEVAVLKNSLIYNGLTVKMLSIIGGFFGSIAFAAFLLAMGIANSEFALIVTGAIFIGAAIYLNRVTENILLDTSTIAAYMIGCGMLGVGLTEYIHSESGLSCFFMLLALATLWLTESYMLLLLAVLLFCGCFYVLAFENHVGFLTPIFFATALYVVSFSEVKIITHSYKANIIFRPLQMGLFASLMVMVLFLQVTRDWSMYTTYNFWVFPIVLCLGILHLCYVIARAVDITNIAVLALIFSILCSILTLFFGSELILAAIFCLLLSYQFGYNTQITLSIMLLIYGISRYYYDLDLTLLAKSGILFFTGMAMLIGWYFFNKCTKYI